MWLIWSKLSDEMRAILRQQCFVQLGWQKTGAAKDFYRGDVKNDGNLAAKIGARLYLPLGHTCNIDSRRANISRHLLERPTLSFRF